MQMEKNEKPIKRKIKTQKCPVGPPKSLCQTWCENQQN